MTPSEYEQLKKAADEQAKLAERKKGELARIDAELKREFGSGDPKKIVKELEKKLSQQEKMLEAELVKFNEKHPGILE